MATVNQLITDYMKTIRPNVIIALAPSKEVYKTLRANFLAQTGTDNTFEHQEVWDKMVLAAYTEFKYENISLEQAQIHAEPIRIAHPEQCVSIHTTDGECYIGNTTWNDQIKMFFEYPTYTKEGKAIMEARAKEAKELGVVASWE